MLILARKLGEQIQIGPDITLTVVEINGNVIRLGIEAPKEVTILRKELLFKPAWCEASEDQCIGITQQDISNGIVRCAACDLCNTTKRRELALA